MSQNQSDFCCEFRVGLQSKSEDSAFQFFRRRLLKEKNQAITANLTIISNFDTRKDLLCQGGMIIILEDPPWRLNKGQVQFELEAGGALYWVYEDTARWVIMREGFTLSYRVFHCLNPIYFCNSLGLVQKEELACKKDQTFGSPKAMTAAEDMLYCIVDETKKSVDKVHKWLTVVGNALRLVRATIARIGR